MLLPLILATSPSIRMAQATPVVLTDGFGLEDRGHGIHQVPRDPVFFAIANGSLKLPSGRNPNGWTAVKADAKGHFSGHFTDNGWIALQVNEDAATTMLLDARGDSYALINGTPRVGDVYETGHVKLPIHLNKGTNNLLFRCARGDLQVTLEPITNPIEIDPSDPTLPDLRPGQTSEVWGAELVRNATDSWQSNLKIEVNQGHRKTTTHVPAVMPMSLIKAGFEIDPKAGPDLELKLFDGNKLLMTSKVNLRVRKPGETYKETFLSSIDGSVQYFAVNPAWNPVNAALALSLHGAGVEAIGQADAYSSKPWCNIVCPTNRRPFGFDWEDWGRMDALEVLGIAKKELQPDPAHIYLVGHSMGGHGTILNGALYPGQFAAIAPSAGWVSAATYAGIQPTANPDPAEAVLNLSSYQDETRRYLNNYRSEGIYLLQGGADDNVPPEQERSLAKLLGTFHHDFIYNEVPGQPHWWDINPEPGADCIDLAALWDFLAKHDLPPLDSVHDIDFSTSNPEVSSTEYWATIEQQIAPLRVSRVTLHADPFLRKISGHTRNTAVLQLGLEALHPGGQLEVNLDGQDLKLDTRLDQASVLLAQVDGKWQLLTALDLNQKSPERNGPFRLAFQHRFLFVYGTRGSTDENAALLDKVRYDAETWWYRANGSIDIEPDTKFEMSQAKGRNVILYGNANTNSAWNELLGSCPVTIGENSAKAFGKSSSGSNLSGLFWWPQSGSRVNSVGVVGASGLDGIRALYFLPYLQPMTGYPDYLLFDTSAIDPGQAQTGIVSAGFYSNDYKSAANSGQSDLLPTPLDRVEDLPYTKSKAGAQN